MAKVTICGGNNAAHVLTAFASYAGWEVDIFTMTPDEAQRLNDATITAKNNGQSVSGKPRRVSTNPAEVIPGSELVLLTLPAFAHSSALTVIADHLDNGTSIGVLPSRGGFDWQACHLLDIDGRSLTIFGLQTLPWACRITIYGQEVEILGTKVAVDIAVQPATEQDKIIQLLSFIPDVKLTPVHSFLTLTLANTGQLLHPGIMYGLTAGKEDKVYAENEIPLFYQSIDEFTADILQSLSDEIQAIAKALGEQLPSFDPTQVIALHDWVRKAYEGLIEDHSTLQRAFASNTAYAAIKTPSRKLENGQYSVDFKGRYLSEDIPFGLVVVRGIAELVGVSTPIIDKIIIWAQTQLDKTFLENGSLSGADISMSRAPQAYGIQTLEDLRV